MKQVVGRMGLNLWLSGLVNYGELAQWEWEKEIGETSRVSRRMKFEKTGVLFPWKYEIVGYIYLHHSDENFIYVFSTSVIPWTISKSIIVIWIFLYYLWEFES